jgi:hypothetical protein
MEQHHRIGGKRARKRLRGRNYCCLVAPSMDIWPILLRPLAGGQGKKKTEELQASWWQVQAVMREGEPFSREITANTAKSRYFDMWLRPENENGEMGHFDWNQINPFIM